MISRNLVGETILVSGVVVAVDGGVMSVLRLGDGGFRLPTQHGRFWQGASMVLAGIYIKKVFFECTGTPEAVHARTHSILLRVGSVQARLVPIGGIGKLTTDTLDMSSTVLA